jgi:acylphosphatase/archaellum biogenesis ATPase FlaH
MTITVRKAKREKLIAAIQIAGPSGAGKTLGGLLMAYGMMKEAHPEISEAELWDKIGLIDTEHERSLVYEGMERQGVKVGEFLFVPLDAPYTVSRYDQSIKALKDAGAEVIVIDSITHAWDGDGGLQDLQQAKGGTFQAWRDVNPFYEQFIKLVTGEKHQIHTIATVRLKQSYEVDKSETGKLNITKIGLKQVQRDSLEYEFQIVFNTGMDHIAHTTKDNSGLFEGVPAKITPEHGKKLIQWLEKGIDVKGKEEEDRQNFIHFIREMEAAYNGPVSAKIEEIETKMKKPIEELPFNLVQLAYARVNEVISKVEQAQ